VPEPERWPATARAAARGSRALEGPSKGARSPSSDRSVQAGLAARAADGEGTAGGGGRALRRERGSALRQGGARSVCAASRAGFGMQQRPWRSNLRSAVLRAARPRLAAAAVSCGGAAVPGRGAAVYFGRKRRRARTIAPDRGSRDRLRPAGAAARRARAPQSPPSPIAAMPTPRALLIAALAVAVGFGVGIGVGAAIWEGSSSASPAAAAAAASPAAANETASWLFVATAESGVVTATGDDTVLILMRGTAPRVLAFTDRPARQAQSIGASDLMAGPTSLLYANASAPPNGALTFVYNGDAAILPVEMLNVTGAAPDYTVVARVLGAGGVAHLGATMVENEAGVVRGAGHPLWAAIEAGLEVEAPAMFIDNFALPFLGGCPLTGCFPPGYSPDPLFPLPAPAPPPALPPAPSGPCKCGFVPDDSVCRFDSDCCSKSCRFVVDDNRKSVGFVVGDGNGVCDDCMAGTGSGTWLPTTKTGRCCETCACPEITPF
jgi:hypothetical protein